MVKVKQDTFIIHTPLTPNTLPNSPLKIAAKKGKNIILKYISHHKNYPFDRLYMNAKLPSDWFHYGIHETGYNSWKATTWNPLLFTLTV